MDCKFSIHGIFNVAVSGVPERIKVFLSREFGHFSTDRLDSADLEIRFVEKVSIPDSSIRLLDNFFYNRGDFYFDFSGAILNVPIKDISRGNMVVLSERNVPEWMIFYVVEKILHVKILEKDFCFFHAGGVTDNEKAVLYSSLQAGGKTEWTLRKLEDKAGFFGDDQVLANRSGYVFSYPRGINVNKYHGPVYNRALRSRSSGSYIKHRSYVSALHILRFLFWFDRELRKRVENSILSRSSIRVNIREIFPENEIIDKKRLDRIIIALKTNPGRAFSEKWTLKRSANFLLMNTNYERLAYVDRYLQAFWAFGDDYAVRVKQYLKRLARRELNTVCRIIKKCEVETTMFPDGKE